MTTPNSLQAGSKIGKYTFSSGASSPHFHQGDKTQVHSSKDRQHNSPFLLGQDGGYQIPSDDTSEEKDMGAPDGTQYSPHRGMDLDSSQYESRPRIEEHQGLIRVEIGPWGVPPAVPESRESDSRLICLTDIPPADTVHELEVHEYIST